MRNNKMREEKLKEIRSDLETVLQLWHQDYIIISFSSFIHSLLLTTMCSSQGVEPIRPWRGHQ